MRYRALILASLLWPGCALPDVWSGMASKIPGVEFSFLGRDESGFYSGLLDGESKEFISHCTRGGMVYLSGFVAPAKCQMGDRDKGGGEFVEIRLETKESQRAAGLFLMSKKVIPPRKPLFDLSAEELEMLKSADRQSLLALDTEVLACYQSRYKEMDESTARIDRQIGRAVTTRTITYKQDHESYVRAIKSSAQYKKFIGKKYKFSSPNGSIYVSSLGAYSCDLMGWDLVNVVYVMKNEALVEVTRFSGCIEGGFRDLNGDGVPEVLTSTCENGESNPHHYWSIYPTAKVLLQR